MALAPAAYLRWTNHLRHSPQHPGWANRDRFVLSCGHASMLLYGLLHLSGNVRQWILGGLGGAPDTRDRPLEFSEPGPIPTEELIALLDSTMAEARTVIREVRPGDLLGARPVQRYEETALSILVHVVEHFSYHTGQITYAAKALKALDMGYYPELE